MRDPPCHRGFVGVAGANHDQARYRAQRRQLLHRLVRRSVFADADAVVGKNVNHAAAPSAPPGGSTGAGNRRKSERRAEGDDAAVRRHAVQRRAHAVLAHAEVDVASGVTPAAARRALLIGDGPLPGFRNRRASAAR